MKGGFILLPFALAMGAFAQAPAPPAVPQLTMTEKVALQSIFEKAKAVQEQQKAVSEALHEIEAEIKATHAGYHLSEATGQLEKDSVPAAAPTKK